MPNPTDNEFEVVVINNDNRLSLIVICNTYNEAINNMTNYMFRDFHSESSYEIQIYEKREYKIKKIYRGRIKTETKIKRNLLLSKPLH